LRRTPRYEANRNQLDELDELDELRRTPRYEANRNTELAHERLLIREGLRRTPRYEANRNSELPDVLAPEVSVATYASLRGE